MLTENFTFQLGDTGVILNTDSTSLPFVDITTVDGFDMAPFRETTRDHEGVDGGYIDAEFEKGREISLEGNVYCTAQGVEAYLDTLKENYQPTASVQPLYIKADDSAGVRVVFVKSRGVRYSWTSLARSTGVVPIRFGLYAEDPRQYDSNLQSVVIPFGSLAYTGIAFPLGFSFGFGGSSLTTDGAYVLNAGNRPTPAVITIAGPVTNPQIINETVSVSMVFNIDLSSTDTLTVDLGNHTVRLNGTANRRYTLMGTKWFMLAKGNNFLRFRGSSGTAPATMTVQFRSAWR